MMRTQFEVVVIRYALRPGRGQPLGRYFFGLALEVDGALGVAVVVDTLGAGFTFINPSTILVMRRISSGVASSGQ